MILRRIVLAALLIAGVCGQEEASIQETPALKETVEAVAGDADSPSIVLPVAQERFDNFADSGVDDQIALESNIAEERDGGGHHVVVAPPQDNYAAESIDSYSAPQPANQYSAPQQQQQDSYGSPQAPVEDGYGSPQAPPVSNDGYGAPQAPPVSQDSYGSPQAPPHSGPIPVPLPVPVRPQSLVLPQQPGGGYGAPQPPKYKPRPPPPKKPQYRPPPKKRPPPPPKKPSYRPPPKKPSYRPPPAKPQYKPRPPPPQKKPTYGAPPKPKPQYKPPSRPQYKPPKKPQYRPPQKPQYRPPKKPSYRPQPSQHKPQYRPAPRPKQPTYKAPAPAPAPVAPTYGGNSGGDAWPQTQPEMPKITSLDVTCEKNLMKVFIEFDKPFYGIIFSKGHYSDVNCVHLPAGLGRKNAKFDVSINSCGTTGNTENGLYGYGADSGSGTFFENTIVIQYDPQVQEVWDQARKLRCTWHDQYEKSVTFRPFPVDMLDVVRADFAGDNVGCWMQIQVGKGPWASEVSGLVKIGQTMTMVLAIKDDEQKFDMMVRNCMAHDGKRAPIQLVDQKGCVTRPKLMSKFTKIKNFGASASVLSYAHFQAFKFPDSMEVHFQCTIQICRYQCPEQCDAGGNKAPAPAPSTDTYGSPQAPAQQDSYGSPQAAPVQQDSYGSPQAAPVQQDSYGSPQGNPHGRRRRRETLDEDVEETEAAQEDLDQEYEEYEEQEPTTSIEIDLEDVGVQKVIQVVSSGDLTFAIKEGENDTSAENSMYPPVTQSWAGEQGYICMSTPAFAATLVILLAILVISCLLSAFLCLRHRSFYGESSLIAAFANPVFAHNKKGHY